MKSPTGFELRKFLKKHQITRRRAAELIHVTTVQMDRYCLPTHSPNYRPMPPGLWELLQLKASVPHYP